MKKVERLRGNKVRGKKCVDFYYYGTAGIYYNFRFFIHECINSHFNYHIIFRLLNFFLLGFEQWTYMVCELILACPFLWDIAENC